jgi:predicted double-glycine peptidase
MRLIRLFTWAAFLAALLFAAFPASADCPVGDPACLPAPPGSVQVNPHPATADGDLTDVEAVGEFIPLEAVIPMPAPRADVVPLGNSAPSFSSLSVPVRYQDPSDVSCGVQALGMALDGLGAGAPASSALLGFLQGNGMMYDFGTGVEELAYAAQSFGYRGSYAFHNASLADLSAQLAAGSPVVVSLGANGQGQPGHFVTVTGVSADGQWVTYNDPTLGRVVVSAEEFLRLWGLQGNSGVSVATAPPPSAPDPMPWVALMAGIMALVSTTPFGRQRMDVGGRITSGGGAVPDRPPKPAPKAAPKPAPKPALAPPRAPDRGTSTAIPR